MDSDCLIIGAGLCGLSVAFSLTRNGNPPLVLEARQRFGGRIACETVIGSDGQGARFDLGPAWIWPDLQPLMSNLLETLGVPLFAQATRGAALYEDARLAKPERVAGGSPHAQSYRVAGGALSIAEGLTAYLDPQTLLLGRRVTQVVDESDAVRIDALTADGGLERHWAQRVIFAMPLRLLARTVEFDPPLPQSQFAAFVDTPTWMAGHAKLLACYETPFWRDSGLSGEVFSRCGPLLEIHDASPARGGPYGLFGFFGLPPYERRQRGSRTLIRQSLEQLVRLFGAQAATPFACRIKDWSEDPLTAVHEDSVPLMGHPDYGLAGSLTSLWDGKVVFAGSETAALNGGYLEGALEAAEDAVAQVSLPADE